MKKVVLFFLLFSPMLATAQDFNSVVDFSVELSTLADRERVLELARNGRTVILEGVSEDILVMNGSPVLKLLGGEWIGSEEVRAYSCIFYLDDPKWMEIFPAARPEEPGPDYVPPGSRLLIAARILGWNDDKAVPRAEILDYRLLK